jgi:hypothetical protein
MANMDTATGGGRSALAPLLVLKPPDFGRRPAKICGNFTPLSLTVSKTPARLVERGVTHACSTSDTGFSCYVSLAAGIMYVERDARRCAQVDSAAVSESILGTRRAFWRPPVLPVPVRSCVLLVIVLV